MAKKSPVMGGWDHEWKDEGLKFLCPSPATCSPFAELPYALRYLKSHLGPFQMLPSSDLGADLEKSLIWDLCSIPCMFLAIAGFLPV